MTEEKVKQLVSLQSEIEKMDRNGQLNILRILVDSKVNVSENKYGTHVNLSDLPDEVIDKIWQHINYIKHSHTIE